MTTEDPSNKSASPELFKLNSAFKLAEKWVSNMTRTDDDKPTKVVLEARPPGLGIGAVVPRQPKVGLSSDPVERKIRAQWKRKYSKIEEESQTTPRDNGASDEDDDDEPESRTKAFDKKKASSLPSSN